MIMMAGEEIVWVAREESALLDDLLHLSQRSGVGMRRERLSGCSVC